VALAQLSAHPLLDVPFQLLQPLAAVAVMKVFQPAHQDVVDSFRHQIGSHLLFYLGDIVAYRICANRALS
jgi:hypothetical protein